MTTQNLVDIKKGVTNANEHFKLKESFHGVFPFEKLLNIIFKK